MISEDVSPIPPPQPQGLRKLIVLCSISAVVATFSALVISISAIIDSTNASNAAVRASHVNADISRDIRTLLLDGKTSGAMSERKASQEIHLLVAQGKKSARHHDQTLSELKKISLSLSALEQEDKKILRLEESGR